MLSLFVLKAAAQPADGQYPIIPYPAQLTPAPGYFIITPATRIVLPGGPLFRNEANALNVLLTHSFGQALAVSQGQALAVGTQAIGTAAGKKAIRFTYDSSIAAEEGYHLTITPLGMTIAARTPAGMFMAVQTIRQLLPVGTDGQRGHPSGTGMPLL